MAKTPLWLQGWEPLAPFPTKTAAEAEAKKSRAHAKYIYKTKITDEKKVDSKGNRYLLWVKYEGVRGKK